MDPKTYSGIIKNICATLGVKPDDTLIRNVVAYVKQLNYEKVKLQYKSEDLLNEAIAESYIESIRPNAELDYNSYLKDSVKEKKPNSDTDRLTKWVSEFMPTTASKSISVYIDSRLRNTGNYQSGSSVTDFAFSLVPRQTRAEIGDGRIQITNIPSHITYFKLGRFVLPYTAALRSLNYSNEITLTFTALRANGIIAREDTYHFTFHYSVNATDSELIDLTPTNEYCKFSPPLRIIDDISLRFNDPIYPIAFANDRLRPVAFDYLSSDGRITFEVNHNLTAGDIIIIMGLTSNDDAANANVLNAINNRRGVVVGIVNSNTISTGIDFGDIISPDVNSKPWILFYNKTFRFPIEIGYQGELN